MSITLGIYDLFSYTIPGALYLLIVFQWMSLTTQPVPQFDPGNGTQVLIAAIVSFICGLLMNTISRTFWHKIYRRGKKEVEYEVIEQMRNRYPEADLKLKANQWPVLMMHMRRNHKEIADNLDRSKAVSLMLSNLGFGLLLLGITNAVQLFYQDYAILPGIIAMLCFLFVPVSSRMSLRFDMWFFMGVFEYAITEQLQISEWVDLKTKSHPKKE